MEPHKRILATIYIVYGAFIFFILALVWVVLFGLIFNHHINFDIDASYRELLFVRSIISIIFTFLIIFFVLPSIIGGIGLLYNKRWAFILLIVEGCLNLVNFPVGTAIGAYTLWVFFKDQEIREKGEASTETFEKRDN